MILSSLLSLLSPPPEDENEEEKKYDLVSFQIVSLKLWLSPDEVSARERLASCSITVYLLLFYNPGFFWVCFFSNFVVPL